MRTNTLAYTFNKIVIENYNVIHQDTSINTTVVNNLPNSHILTQTATTSTQGNTTFSVSNSIVTSNSLIQLSINNYSGNQGLPNVRVSNITTGNFIINISNNSVSEALNGTLKIACSVIN